ncbi:MAG: nitrous oxide-stimulated promoter family protein [Desulfobulbaceae bacterium]|nr:nitrous oxide-stimulated promoter family protein [Desulfobulbaceae bacterium]
MHSYKPGCSSIRSARMQRETHIVTLMIHKYCQNHHHQQKTLCSACSMLLRYALARLEHCPFQEKKSTCAQCPIHCYSPNKRQQIKEVMRYAGPRLIWTHPWLGLMHLVNGWRQPRRKT